jgi:hypothetical protein
MHAIGGLLENMFFVFRGCLAYIAKIYTSANVK